jgi:hypothetical protein
MGLGYESNQRRFSVGEHMIRARTLAVSYQAGQVRVGLKMGRVSGGDVGNTLGLCWASRPTVGPHVMGC